MKRVIAVFLGLLIAMSIGAASFAETEHEMHDKQLLFQVNGLDRIGVSTFNGGFGFRYFLGSNFALRPSVSYSKTEETRAPDSSGRYGYTAEVKNYDVDILLEYHLEPKGRLSSYWGGGFSLGESTDETVYTTPDSLVTGDRLSRNRDSDSFSGIGVLGVQWQAADYMYLGAEYQLRYRTEESDEVYLEYDRDTREAGYERSSFAASTSSLFLAVRF